MYHSAKDNGPGVQFQAIFSFLKNPPENILKYKIFLISIYSVATKIYFIWKSFGYKE